MGNFTKDLGFGKKWELLAQQILGENVVEVAEGCFKDWDFRTANATYEVKSDRYAFKTNCCFVEYECSNKPSGISTTKADYYVYFVVKPNEEYDWYKIPTQVLKDQPSLRNVSGGDGFRSKGRIVSLANLQEYKC